MKKRFRFEFGYPRCSCYTEPDIRYIARRSRTLAFNKKKFDKSSRWLGVSGEFPGSQPDVLERLYRRPGCKDPSTGMPNGLLKMRVGTASIDSNSEPLFFREGRIVCFTVRAVFAGRSDTALQETVKACCDKQCLVCGARISTNGLCTALCFHGSHRIEVMCIECWKRIYRTTERDYQPFMWLYASGLIRLLKFMKNEFKEVVGYE